MAEEILSMKNIIKSYYLGEEEQVILKGINLNINRGEFVSILGPSGSGKSTMMNIIGCLDKASSGQYVLSGRDIKDLDENELAEIRSKEIGFIFQSFQLFPLYPSFKTLLTYFDILFFIFSAIYFGTSPSS